MFSPKEIAEEIKKLEPELSVWREMFHRIPEKSMEEFETTEEIIRQLTGMGDEPVALSPTGVCACVGPEKGYTLALRADIDGLPVEEKTGLPFASVHPGWMHACGHDGHIAGLLGVAKVLKQMEEKLTVRVKLIFQPSEENTCGAKMLLKQGIHKDVDEIFGLHLFSDMERGTFSIEEGPRMAQTDRFFLTFYGKGGHAGKPHQCVDATVMAADFVMNIQNVVSREISPADGAVITVGSFHSGTQYNVISGEAKLEGTCRSFREETAEHLKEAIYRRAKAVADGYGGNVEISYDFGSHPPVVNEPEMTHRIEKEARAFCEDARMVSVPPLMLGEDFSWYQTKIPGVFAFAGCGSDENGVCYPNHHPKFDIAQSALPMAVKLHMSAVQAAMRKVEQ